MKSTFRIDRVNPEKELLLALDVSKDSLSYRAELPVQGAGGEQRVVETLSGSIRNRSGQARRLFAVMRARAQQAGYEHVRVLCEPTGGYEQKVLRLARQQGFLTSYVSGESVHKAKVIDHNDTGKSDQLDPGVILTLGRLGKVQTHRVLPPLYEQLRLLNRLYSAEDESYVRTKCRLNYAIRRLFCDLSCKSQFYYSNAGRGLMQRHCFNPDRILRSGQKRFDKAIRGHSRCLAAKTLRRLWEDAVSSNRHTMSSQEQAVWEQQVQYAWEEYLLHERRREQLRGSMEQIYRQLLQRNELVPRSRRGFLSEFRIARILAETGPLSDFANPQAILKYAGLNLCQRQSGKWQGKIKMSHKGNAQLRDALGEAAFGMVRSNRCYGPYYHRKTRQENTPGTRAMVAVARKLLVAFWTMGIKQVAFDQNRLLNSESQLRKAA
jgi:transposase